MQTDYNIIHLYKKGIVFTKRTKLCGFVFLLINEFIVFIFYEVITLFENIVHFDFNTYLGILSFAIICKFDKHH